MLCSVSAGTVFASYAFFRRTLFCRHFMNNSPTLNIIGCGKLGKTLGRLWADRQVFTIQDVLNREPQHSAQAIAFIGAGRAVAHYRELRPAQLTLIAASDDQIGACCEQLADSGMLDPASIVFHCSGALPCSVLIKASQHGAAIASAHPVASFAQPEQMLGHFQGTYCAIEGDAAALPALSQAFTTIGAIPVNIDGNAKTVYHAAAVFAANYVVTLLDIAAQLYEKAGIERSTAYAMMQPLVDGNISNVFRLGAAAALSGPVARGDAATVLRQHAALDALDAPLGALYRQLAGHTAQLAQRPDPFDDQPPPLKTGGR